MKKIFFAFAFGIILGGSIIYALALVEGRDQIDALGTLDFLIEQWSFQREPVDTVHIAQLRVELPDTRSGFFPDTVVSLAKQIELRYRIPKGVTLAQWALESNWGRSNLSASNYFGHTLPAVRRFMEKPESVMRREKVMRAGSIVDGRPVAFARYRTLAECFDVHGKYLSSSHRYRNAFKEISSERFARELSRAGYAEDPDYALKLITIMRRYKL